MLTLELVVGLRLWECSDQIGEWDVFSSHPLYPYYSTLHYSTHNAHTIVHYTHPTHPHYYPLHQTVPICSSQCTKNTAISLHYAVFCTYNAQCTLELSIPTTLHFNTAMHGKNPPSHSNVLDYITKYKVQITLHYSTKLRPPNQPKYVAS